MHPMSALLVMFRQYDASRMESVDQRNSTSACQCSGTPSASCPHPMQPPACPAFAIPWLQLRSSGRDVGPQRRAWHKVASCPSPCRETAPGWHAHQSSHSDRVLTDGPLSSEDAAVRETAIPDHDHSQGSPGPQKVGSRLHNSTNSAHTGNGGR